LGAVHAISGRSFVEVEQASQVVAESESPPATSLLPIANEELV